MTDLPICDWARERYDIVGSQGRVMGSVSFDEVMTNIDRYSTELLVDVKTPPRGSAAAFHLMLGLREALMKRAAATGDTVMSDLSPPLIGLEGRVVRVKDLHGDERQVRVERWVRDDHPPVHIEINMGARTLAHREYESVEAVS